MFNQNSGCKHLHKIKLLIQLECKNEVLLFIVITMNKPHRKYIEMFTYECIVVVCL